MGFGLDRFGLPGLLNVAGVLQYDHRDAVHHSRQVGKAALVGWHAMVVMITDRLAGFGVHFLTSVSRSVLHSSVS
jgi:hypothetical protein